MGKERLRNISASEITFSPNMTGLSVQSDYSTDKFYKERTPLSYVSPTGSSLSEHDQVLDITELDSVTQMLARRFQQRYTYSARPDPVLFHSVSYQEINLVDSNNHPISDRADFLAPGHMFLSIPPLLQFLTQRDIEENIRIYVNDYHAEELLTFVTTTPGELYLNSIYCRISIVILTGSRASLLSPSFALRHADHYGRAMQSVGPLDGNRHFQWASDMITVSVEIDSD